MGNLCLKDHLLTRILNRMVDIVYLSILWSVASLPLITVGMSSAALYYTVHKCIAEEEGHIWQTFWKAFRQNGKQGTLLWLLLAPIGLMTFSECYLAFQWCDAQKLHPVFFVISLCIAGLLIMWLQYWFAYAARFEDSVKGVLRNTFLIAAANFGPSFLLMVTFLAIALIISCMPELLLLWAIFPALYAMAVHQIAESLFRKYLPGVQTDSTEGEKSGDAFT